MKSGDKTMERKKYDEKPMWKGERMEKRESRESVRL